MPLDSADDHSTTAKPWPPDATCIACGDEFLTLAVRAYAAAGLSDQDIATRIAEAIDDLWPDPPPAGRDPDPEMPFEQCFPGLAAEERARQDLDPDRWRAERAAVALARACAGIRMPPARIDALLASLAPELTGWPDSDALLAIVAAAVEEASA